MFDAALTALETNAAAEALRSSRYAYPLVNAAHILGLAALFGPILALDLRLLGLFSQIPVRPLALVLPRIAACGLAIASLTGLALFSVAPFDYVVHPVFPVKLALIAVATVHALALHRAHGWRDILAGSNAIPTRLRASAALSLSLWTAAILCGRLLAF
ncbi:hypothetical protein [Qipengyuania qiaonensis]|uniref:DUF2214 domain-containing protein n=1 Tax=Qipengyuania qiaonensis TaxID=2867240 RepID=A0ABS7J5H8_9SPHN|nr:hypothetical protein [Qipengyuania qiaonensis]MBX7481516.1 hypothetical protein [Qipengyuania qiaonensis]